MATRVEISPAARGRWPGLFFFVIAAAAVLGAATIVMLIRRHPEDLHALWSVAAFQLVALVPAWRAYKRDVPLDIQMGFLFLYIAINSLAGWAIR